MLIRSMRSVPNLEAVRALSWFPITQLAVRPAGSWLIHSSTHAMYSCEVDVLWIRSSIRKLNGTCEPSLVLLP